MGKHPEIYSYHPQLIHLSMGLPLDHPPDLAMFRHVAEPPAFPWRFEPLQAAQERLRTDGSINGSQL